MNADVQSALIGEYRRLLVPQRFLLTRRGYIVPFYQQKVIVCINGQFLSVLYLGIVVGAYSLSAFHDFSPTLSFRVKPGDE
jgi:hypothetical protein